MKKLFYLLCCLFFGAGFSASATHFKGGEISYLQTGPATFQVTLKVYSYCGSHPAVGNSLNVKAPNCNAGRNITLTKVDSQVISPYGPNIPAVCNGQYLFMTTVETFSGKFTFSASEQTCSDWVLSWASCCRQSSANVQAQGNIYLEAHLKLLPNVVNSSPEFDAINDPVMYVNKYQDHVLSMSAHDPDGDSLVYSLVPGMEGANMPATYLPIPPRAGTSVIINSNPLPPFNALPPGTPGANPQFALLPVVTGNFTPTFPMLSYAANWNLINPATGIPFNPALAQPYFILDALNGELKFNSFYYDSAANHKNHYRVSIMVEEYRKLNGVQTKLSSVRRETFIEIIDGGQNANPVVPNRMVNNMPFPAGGILHVKPGMPLTFQIDATDPNSTDIISMESNVDSVLLGAVFTPTSGSAASATISWTPTAADVRQNPYYFQVRIRDNANPLRGVRIETFAVRVSNTGGVTGIKDDLAFNAEFTAYPNPFTDEVHFKCNAQRKPETIIIYNMLGRQVDQIELSKTASGEQHIKWVNAGKHAAGMYVAKLIAADKTVQTLKFTKL